MGSTLLVAALAITLAFTVAGIGVNHMNVASRIDNAQTARNLAESAISRTLEQVIYSDMDYGSHGNETMTIAFGGQEGTSGICTFDKAYATLKNIPYSTYNLRKDTATTGHSNRVVPYDSLHLVGIGRCNGVERKIESIITVPSFQFALASEGKMNAAGAMLVAGAKNVTDVTLPVNATDEKLTPSHIVSNASGNSAVNLTSQSGDVTVKGYARAMGQITKDSTGVKIEQGERPGSSRVSMPELDPRQFDPVQFVDDPGRLQDVPATGLMVRPSLYRHTGSLTVPDLRLPLPSARNAENDGAVVFVDGDLTINNGIVGKGVIIATGNITVRGAGSANLSSENQAALVAGGSIELLGRNPENSIYKGVVYAKQAARVKDVTVLGSLVKGGDASTNMTVENSNVISVEQVMQFKFNIPFNVGAGQASVNLELGPDPSNPPNRYTLQDFYNSATGHYDKPINQQHIAFRDLDTGQYYLSASDAARAVIRKGEDVSSLIVGQPGADTEEKLTNYFRQLESECLGILTRSLAKIDRWYQKNVAQPKEQGQFTMDPTTFVPIERRFKTVLWKEL